MRDGMLPYPGTRGNSSNPCESGRMFLSSFSYRVHVAQRITDFNHTPIHAAKTGNKIKASLMDLVMNDRISKVGRGSHRDREQRLHADLTELTCSSLELQEHCES